MSTLIKICGITSIQDALLAADAGADCIGLIFVPSSPRNVSRKRAAEMIKALENRVKIVGVFKNASIARLFHCLDQLELDFVQLHGEESPLQCKEIPIPVIKSFSFPGPVDWEKIRPYLEACQSRIRYLLFDRPKGVDCPGWLEHTQELEGAGFELPPYFLAGNIIPETAGEIIARFRPVGIDVASGVESAPGIKDSKKVRALCQVVQNCNRNEDSNQCNR